MRSIFQISLFGSLAVSIAARPVIDQIVVGSQYTVEVVPVKDEKVKAMGKAGLYLCSEVGFRGTCIHYTTPWGECTNIWQTFPPGRREGVSAAGADPGNWCTLQVNCRGRELQIYYPGYKDLREVSFNDKAASYNCAALGRSETVMWDDQQR
ncbi:hypothetical protein CNMCM8980_008293 [Aspergillus fumigatiaffinis]|uniref:Uncharacterized protein n=1 Tax=Aspergillus fumigatiaffinis TaxID=340414 RepID=A0A8H4ME09_9EURO|nr:hypothetical protein CNMCM5878_004134 [Aspergillus fumigatiaffinis]KAF4235380.1 hypothetical protein CNMCM6457_003181 [Aspergillus fumigatiaffinis]KAF4241110.1 hypothetical protein CNMCM6805_004270 [Aspergillus fumigatiaffinis]KAF4246664.1 hypothetical protein CNMCM8980_008293 [Aspergillus fumigatiaffinis]